MEKVLGGAGNLDKYHEEVAGKRFDQEVIACLADQRRIIEELQRERDRKETTPSQTK